MQMRDNDASMLSVRNSSVFWSYRTRIDSHNKERKRWKEHRVVRKNKKGEKEMDRSSNENRVISCGSSTDTRYIFICRLRTSCPHVHYYYNGISIYDHAGVIIN